MKFYHFNLVVSVVGLILLESLTFASPSVQESFNYYYAMQLRQVETISTQEKLQVLRDIRKTFSNNADEEFAPFAFNVDFSKWTTYSRSPDFLKNLRTITKRREFIAFINDSFNLLGISHVSICLNYDSPPASPDRPVYSFCFYDLSETDIPVLKIPTFWVPGPDDSFASTDLRGSFYDFESTKDLIAGFIQQQKKALILDLRDNPGGDLTAAMHLGQFFYPGEIPGVSAGAHAFVGAETGKEVFQEVYNKEVPAFVELLATFEKLPHFEGKIAVLVNSKTLSSAEIFAASLQELVGAKVYGSKTPGSVLYSLIKDIGPYDMYAFMYPVFEWITKSGKRLEGAGVLPDVEFEEQGPFLFGYDPVLERTIRDLKTAF